MMKHTRFHALFLLLALALLGGRALAVVPSTTSFQGYFSDAAGSPLDSSFSIQFAIYNVSTGGVPLWSDTRTVAISKGLLSVQLGGPGAQFPIDLFDNPLWLGIDVGSDGEMSPRMPFDTVAFAFKADDALTLEGQSAASLDQSAHVIDFNNPHAVTAAQTGAADAATLSAHTGDNGNPHAVTAAQVGAATPGDITTHAEDSAAHHIRYSSAEAIAAMGGKAPTNPLHHDRYSNAESVAAVWDADGTGSGLDADQVDGLHASELIDAASDEVRIAIDTLPFPISSPGSYYLVSNLTAGSGGIDITADNVTLDLMGFTLFGNGIGDYGIFLHNRSNVTIRNGTVRDFGFAGIFQGSSTARYVKILDVQVLGNGTLDDQGIHILGSNNHVERCTVGSNGRGGIDAGPGSYIVDNTAYLNGTHGMQVGGGSILAGNTVYSNQHHGIFVGTGSTIIGNTVYSNQDYGISGGDGLTITGNTVYSNQGYGILGGAGSMISGNTVRENGDWGIWGGGSNLIKGNTIVSNNLTDTADRSGLHVGTESRVVGNMLDNNNRYNIYVAGAGNTIEDNHFNGSNYGLFLNTDQSFYANNRAHGNVVNYGNIGGSIDGGGNIFY